MKLYRVVLAIVFLAFISFSCKKEREYRIGISQCSEDDWRMLMNEEIEREIMFHPEAKVEIRSAGDDNDTQISDIRYFVDNGFDIIIAAPNEADALTPVIKEVYDKGIPVLVFDRSIHGDTYTAFQGADNVGIGKEAAAYAARLMPAGGKVIELAGLSGSTPAEGRGAGFKAGLDSINPNLKIIASVPADWNYDDAVRIADSLLTLHPDADIIYAHNDRMALGASDVAARKGLHPHIIGIDAAPNIGMKAVADGKIDATFLYPTEGAQLIHTALDILDGKPYAKNLLIPASSPVDRSNVDLLLRRTEQLNQETEKMKMLKGEVDNYWSKHTSQTALLYAAIAILVLVCIVLFLVLRTFWQHRRHQAELVEKNRLLEEQRDLEKELNSRLAAATQSKLTFFTNVSHDLRTPLTLIAEPVEQVSKGSNLDDRQRMLMKIADKNVKILRRLINQILDFRKYENDKLDIYREEVAPAELAREWTDAFRPLAHKRHIDFPVTVELPEGFTMALDVEKMERVVFNLLSNAFKFTPVKGRVSFSMTLQDNALEITVSDTGRGISEENLKNIFSRFYQVDKVRPEGSGIGLSLAKAFVELHEGTIEVESLEEKGTTFTVLLPVTHSERKADTDSLTLSAESAREVAKVLEDIDDSLPFPEDGEEDSDKPLVLVIDDNKDVRLLIRELLGDEYKIIGADGGKEGIKLAARYVPDAIICDVMMPGMDGLETCGMLKSEISTSHIPVLMLTACSMDEQRVQGYASGADGYMAKPFNSDVLKARLSSLIANRRRIKEVLGADTLPGAASDSRTTAQPKDTENEFYGRFVAIIGRELGNPELSVDALAEMMGMGRSQFYRKIKALTGLSPVELLRDMRLKKARELLLSTDKSVSEIAYEVGFSTPAYFTKCYREVYAETPTALRERLGG